MPRKAFYLITCEHGGNRIPKPYAEAFHGVEALLRSHRGYDPGALVMARELADGLKAPLFFSTVSRLLIDLNRSPGHPRLYSEATRSLPPAARREILQRHYLPYRNQVEGCIAAAIAQGRRVVHVSSHSFTPVLDGEVRKADIGLLYDPARAREKSLCLCWQSVLQQAAPLLRIRRNYPYTGTSDGLTTYLRRRFTAEEYVGVELEINQQHPLQGGAGWRRLRALVMRALLLSASGCAAV